MALATVAVVAFDGISPFHLSVPCVVLGEDRREDGIPRYDVSVCALEKGTVSTNSGFSIHIDHDVAAIERAGTVIVPSWRSPSDQPPKALLDAHSHPTARPRAFILARRHRGNPSQKASQTRQESCKAELEPPVVNPAWRAPKPVPPGGRSHWITAYLNDHVPLWEVAEVWIRLQAMDGIAMCKVSRPRRSTGHCPTDPRRRTSARPTVAHRARPPAGRGRCTARVRPSVQLAHEEPRRRRQRSTAT